MQFVHVFPTIGEGTKMINTKQLKVDQANKKQAINYEAALTITSQILVRTRQWSKMASYHNRHEMKTHEQR